MISSKCSMALFDLQTYKADSDHVQGLSLSVATDMLNESAELNLWSQYRTRRLGKHAHTRQALKRAGQQLNVIGTPSRDTSTKLYRRCRVSSRPNASVPSCPGHRDNLKSLLQAREVVESVHCTASLRKNLLQVSAMSQTSMSRSLSATLEEVLASDSSHHPATAQ